MWEYAQFRCHGKVDGKHAHQESCSSSYLLSAKGAQGIDLDFCWVLPLELDEY